uniref:Uncharacterized protein n=1 Tax=Rhizophora mucronata TaxID=61149 RepID=A0A2P2P2T4_RHIMU
MIDRVRELITEFLLLHPFDKHLVCFVEEFYKHYDLITHFM